MRTAFEPIILYACRYRALRNPISHTFLNSQSSHLFFQEKLEFFNQILEQLKNTSAPDKQIFLREKLD